MYQWKNKRLFAIPLLLALFAGSIMASPARADDETPPPPDTSTEIAAPTPDEPVLDPGTGTESGLEALPEGTDLVVLDEDGESVPLASQEAAQAIADGDPIWCPAGVAVPVSGGMGCSANYTEMKSLIDDLLNPFGSITDPAMAGVIWIHKDYNSNLHDLPGTDDFTLNGTVLPNMSLYSLTIKGGWNGLGTGTIDAIDTSLFIGDSLSILNWSGSVTISNIEVSAANSNPNILSGLYIETARDIKLTRVSSSNNAGALNGATLDNTSGTESVTIKNSNFNSNPGSGLQVTSDGAITLIDVTARYNAGGHGANLNNSTAAGPRNVTLSGLNTFTNNGNSGLSVFSLGNITARALIADFNASYGVYLDNSSSFTAKAVSITGWGEFKGNIGSDGLNIASNGAVTLNNIVATYNGGTGVYIQNDNLGTVASPVKINGVNNFSANTIVGLYINSDGAIRVSNVTANGNGWEGVNLTNEAPPSPQSVTIIGFLVANQNGEEGLEIRSQGAITAANLTTNNNGNNGTYLDNTYALGGAHKPVTISGTNVFNDNSQEGLDINSKGAVTLSNLTAIYNDGTNGGVYIRNDADPLVQQNVTLKGTHLFYDNNYGGLSIYSYGAVTLGSVTAGNNGHSLISGDGMNINNNGGTFAKPVRITGTNSFNENYDNGLVVYSDGAITVANITAYWNGLDGTYLNNVSASVTPAKVTILGYGLFELNSDDGLVVLSRGAFTSKNLNANFNLGDGAILETIGLAGTAPQSMTLNGNNTFTYNGGSGLIVDADGNIKVNNLNASFNQNTGADLDNYSNWSSGTFVTFGSVTVSGFGNFNGNVTGEGIVVSTHGKATLTRLTADRNGNDVFDNGIHIAADGNVSLICSGAYNNNGNGLWIHNTASLSGPVPLLTIKGFYASGNTWLDEEYYYTVLVRTNCP